MSNNKYIQFLSNIDIKYLDEQFERKIRVKNDRNEEIFFSDFREIVTNFYKFQRNQFPTQEYLDKIRKKLKDSTSSEVELVVGIYFY